MCDCKIITTAICFGLHWYSIRCIQPAQRCISSRQMTDSIFMVETTALVHVASATRDSGIFMINHSSIFHVLEMTELLVFIRQFLRLIYNNSIADVEFAGKTRGQFFMARGVRQGYFASGLPFDMDFDPIFRWLHDSISPRNLAAQVFLELSPCAHVDDFAARWWTGWL